MHNLNLFISTTFCTFLTLPKTYWVYHNVPKIIMWLLSFILIFALSRTRIQVSYFMRDLKMVCSKTLALQYLSSIRCKSSSCFLDSSQFLVSSTYTSATSSCQNNNKSKMFYLWHRRLCHPCITVLSHLLKHLYINFNSTMDLSFCQAC